LLLVNFLSGQKHNLLPDTIGLCAGDSATIEVRHQYGNNASIKWITPGGTINGLKKIKASVQGKYYIKITSSEFLQPIIDSSFVRIYNKPELKLKDTAICPGNSLMIDAGNPGMRYLWSNSHTSQKIRLNNPGIYWLKITNGKCVLADTFNVRMRRGSGINLPSEMTFCLNEEQKIISAKANPDARIIWNTGATGNSININKEGTYWAKAFTEECGMESDTVKVRFKACECEMIIPNSFTPNEDSRNDYFFPVLQCEYSYYAITISDRWGNTVFSSNNPGSKWDGRYKGNLCPEDIYVYRIESTEKGNDKKTVRSGHISLFR
jgi:gliding motility-associated-like protein